MARNHYVPVRLNDEEFQMVEKLVKELSHIKELTKADVIRYAIQCTYEIDVLGYIPSKEGDRGM